MKPLWNRCETERRRQRCRYRGLRTCMTCSHGEGIDILGNSFPSLCGIKQMNPHIRLGVKPGYRSQLWNWVWNQYEIEMQWSVASEVHPVTKAVWNRMPLQEEASWLLGKRHSAPTMAQHMKWTHNKVWNQMLPHETKHETNYNVNYGTKYKTRAHQILWKVDTWNWVWTQSMKLGTLN